MNYSLNNLCYAIGDLNINSIDYATKNPSHFRYVTDFFEFCSLKSSIALITRSTSAIDHILNMKSKLSTSKLIISINKKQTKNSFSGMSLIKHSYKKNDLETFTENFY